MPDDALAADPALESRCVTTLRMLSVDMVEAAGSGHPGLPLGAAPMAWVVWSRILRHDPTDPTWPDRDRFVLSAGHGSALLYALLHLFGYGLSTVDLAAFRQRGSRTPGHPEHGHTPGVEVTTGPLGQGLAHAVGMALAERMAAARFDAGPAADLPIVGHRTFVLCSDGDLMEGVSGEASSLAGHLGLDRLVVLWDDNRISIDGATSLAFSEDVCERYRAYGWSVHEVGDGNDLSAIEAAVRAAVAEPGRPGFVRVRTTIGYGSPTKAGTAGAHGAPLGAREVAELRRRFDWPEDALRVPADVERHVAALAAAGRSTRLAWERRFAAWTLEQPDLAAEWERRMRGDVDPAVVDQVPRFDADRPIATRSASGAVLDVLGPAVPELAGGSADLAESTCTRLPGEPVQAKEYAGRHIHFGVREHAMAAILNGMSLHGGFRPIGSTFLAFADYARPALRLAAIMAQPVIHLYTHDSIGLGEDGPTHQPVEQLASLRCVPGVAVLRPADANEVIECWRVALGRRDGPTALSLSRQALPVLPPGPAGWISRWGARVVRGAEKGAPRAALVATGSEVALALRAADLLEERQVPVLVISAPWLQRFLALDAAAREMILPPGLPTVAVEAGVAQGWERLQAARVLTLDRFGMSGRGPEVQEALGFSPVRVAEAVLEVLLTAGALR